MTTICITNSIEGIRSCVIRGQHLTGCLHTEPDDDGCKGCLPYPAEHGFLCANCWAKWQAALADSVDLICHLRSVERGPRSVDGVRNSTVSQPGIPATWQQASDLWVLLASVAIEHAKDTNTAEPNWPFGTSIIHGFLPYTSQDAGADATRSLIRWVRADADTSINRVHTAEAAIRYFTEFQNATHRFDNPLQELSKPVPNQKCPKCKRFSMRDTPPLEQFEDRILKCDTPGCGKTIDFAMQNWNLLVWADQVWSLMNDTEPATVAGREALPRQIVRATVGPDERRIIRTFNTDPEGDAA